MLPSGGWGSLRAQFLGFKSRAVFHIKQGKPSGPLPAKNQSPKQVLVGFWGEAATKPRGYPRTFLWDFWGLQPPTRESHGVWELSYDIVGCLRAQLCEISAYLCICLEWVSCRALSCGVESRSGLAGSSWGVLVWTGSDH